MTLADPWSPIFTPYCGANVVLPHVQISPTVMGEPSGTSGGTFVQDLEFVPERTY